MRINARLDETYSSKLNYLLKSTGLSISELVKQGIQALFEKVQTKPQNVKKILMETGFIGCGSGSSDLSSNYKKYLKKDLGKKYDPS